MDEAWGYYQEAKFYIGQLTDVSLADFFLEETEESKKINEKNEKASKGAIGALKNAINSLIEMIKKALTAVKDFITTLGMTKEEREAYKNFKQVLKDNPDLGKVQITVDDYREYEKAYDEALKELDSAAKRDDFDEEKANSIIDKLKVKISDLGDRTKTAGKRAVMVVSLNTAHDIADRNATAAKALNFALQNELVSLEGVSKELGDVEAYKFAKDVNKYAKNTPLHRAKVWILYRKKQSLMDIMEKQQKELLKYTNVGKDGSKNKVDLDSISRGMTASKGNKKLTGAVLSAYDSDIKGGKQGIKDAKKTIKDAQKDMDKAVKDAKTATKDIKKLFGK